MFSTRVPVIYF